MSIQTDGFGTIFKNGEGSGGGGGGGGGGVEFLVAGPDGGNQGNLSLSVQVSVVVNNIDGSVRWTLPDGTDGMIKEIVSPNQSGASSSGQFTGIFSTNSFSNDLIDLEPGESIRLVWSTAGGGWIVISTCSSLGIFWD